MLKLPKVPYTMDKDQAVAIPFRGINFSDRLSDGDIADSFGISMRRYPFVTNKRGRKDQNQEKFEWHVMGQRGKHYLYHEDKLAVKCHGESG